MDANELFQITDLKLCSRIRTTDDSNREGASGNFISAKDFAAVDLANTIQSDHSSPYSRTNFGRNLMRRWCFGIEDRRQDLAIASASAEYTAYRVHHVGFTGR